METRRQLLTYYFKVKHLFKNLYQEPFDMSPGQQQIFRAIYDPTITRVCIKATTQYGKSEVAAMALLAVACDRREKILIIAPSGSQASIIMGKIIDHLFDHELITAMIDYNEGTIEKLRQEKSKTRITFRNGSEIRILTAEAHMVSKESKNLMGFGATIVLVDESGLIPDNMYSKILRMVGGVRNGKIIQLGNPFEDNHFGKAFKSKLYHKISIDYRQALAEKRLTQEFLDEARDTISELDWIVFYETRFPENGSEDALIPRAWIELAVNQKGLRNDYKQSGLDVARFGRDKTVYAFRIGNELQPLEEVQSMDTMEVTGWVAGKLNRDKPDRLCTDIVGIGSGVHDRLEEVQGGDNMSGWEDTELVPVNVGESPTDDYSKGRFYNLRAQIFWALRDLFKPDKDGKSQVSIPDDRELKRQLEELRYSYSSERKYKIEPKEEMKKRLGVSPDKADAVAMAYWNYEETGGEATMYIAET